MSVSKCDKNDEMTLDTNPICYLQYLSEVHSIFFKLKLHMFTLLAFFSIRQVGSTLPIIHFVKSFLNLIILKLDNYFFRKQKVNKSICAQGTVINYWCQGGCSVMHYVRLYLDMNNANKTTFVGNLVGRLEAFLSYRVN